MAGNDGIDTVLFRALRLRSGQAPLRNSLLLFCLVLLSQGTPAQEYKDFLNGQKFEDADSASKAISAVRQDQIKAVLDATADYALKIPACSGTIAVCGFCRGGGWAFMYANENQKLKATYSFYGEAPDSADKVKNIAGPVYGFYGENDERVNATIPKAEELMKAAGKKYEPVIYKGPGHGFMRSGEPNNPAMREADKKARDEAWARWKTLLKQL